MKNLKSIIPKRELSIDWILCDDRLTTFEFRPKARDFFCAIPARRLL